MKILVGPPETGASTEISAAGEAFAEITVITAPTSRVISDLRGIWANFCTLLDSPLPAGTNSIKAADAAHLELPIETLVNVKLRPVSIVAFNTAEG